MDRRSIVEIRFPTALHGTIISEDCQEEKFLVRNISKSGAAFEAEKDLIPESRVRIHLNGLPPKSIDIVWVHGNRAGGKFVEPLTAKEIASLGQFFEDATEIGDEALGETLRRLRRSLGLTQAVLASAVGTSRETVWSWETGKTRPSMDKVFRAFAFFDTLDHDQLGLLTGELPGDAYETARGSISDSIRELQNRVAKALGVDAEIITIDVRVDGSKI